MNACIDDSECRDSTCNVELNTEEYHWDGGDCCSDTCQNIDDTICEGDNRNCLNPTSL